LATQIRKSLFSVFRNLPQINVKAAPSKVKTWKELRAVKECYEKLHSEITEDDDETWCGRIIHGIWGDSPKTSNEQIAFAVSVCESFLDPNNEVLKTDSKYLNKKLKKNIVSIKNIRNFVITNILII
jgi:hypothetical protein